MTEQTKFVSADETAVLPPVTGAGPATAKPMPKKEESDSPFAVAVTDVYEGPLDLLLDLLDLRLELLESLGLLLDLLYLLLEFLNHC